MRQTGELTAGWLDTSIGTLLSSDDALIAEFPFMLITSIDSSTVLVELPIVRFILSNAGGARMLGAGLVLPAESLKAAIRQYGMFTGFDEVWCFKEEPRVAKPDQISLVAPTRVETDGLPEGLASWMAASGCAAGFGDGLGTNFVTRVDWLAEHLAKSAPKGVGPASPEVDPTDDDSQTMPNSR